MLQPVTESEDVMSHLQSTTASEMNAFGTMYKTSFSCV